MSGSKSVIVRCVHGDIYGLMPSEQDCISTWPGFFRAFAAIEMKRPASKATAMKDVKRPASKQAAAKRSAPKPPAGRPMNEEWGYEKVCECRVSMKPCLKSTVVMVTGCRI